MAKLFRLLIGVSMAGAVLAGLLLAAGFFVFVDRLARSEDHPGMPVDGVVALTGGSERIADAVDLLARGVGKRLLITGVNEKTTREELARLRPEFRSWFACCVDLDYRALNTIGNAEQTRSWARSHQFRTLLVVTSTYHMPRTLAELGHALPEVNLVPHAVVPGHLDLDAWWRDPALTRLLAREYAKYVVAVARIAIHPAGELTGVARRSSSGDGLLLRKS